VLDDKKSKQLFKMLNKKKLLGLLVTPAIALMFFINPLPADANLKSLSLSTGDPGTPYHEFGLIFKEYLENKSTKDFNLKVQESSGSIQNLKNIENKTSNIAIVQNDVAHYSFYGKHSLTSNKGFAAIFPLFSENIWIISKTKSNIRGVSDFKNKVISVGSLGSGTHLNALDILESAGLRQGIDYIGKSLNTKDSINGLIQGNIDISFFTSQSLPSKFKQTSSSYKIHDVPQIVISDIVSKKFFYEESNLKHEGATVSTLAVRSYLVGEKELNYSEIKFLIKTLIDRAPEMQMRGFNLGNVNQSLKKITIPLHDDALQVFEELGHLTINRKGYYLFVLIILVIFLVIYSSRRVKSYDRLGRPIEGNSVLDKIVEFASKGEAFIYSILIFLFILFSVVVIIQYFESEYIKEFNVESDFLNLSLIKASLVLFCYMAGFVGKAFPISDTGQFIAAFLPLLGVAAVAAIFLIFLEKSREQAERIEKGLSKLIIKNHILIFGWNSVAPELIYNLTSSDSPEKNKIVVIGDFEGKKPLDQYGFDRKLVFYCRGKSTDFNTLGMASTNLAKAAIVLANKGEQDGQNEEGILTNLAIRDYCKKSLKDEKHIHVSSELIHQENVENFIKSGSNSTINASLLINNLIGLTCISPNIINFILNILTYDDREEIYSIPAIDVRWAAGKRISELNNILASNGINLVGVHKDGNSSNINTFPEIKIKKEFIALTCKDNFTTEINNNDILLHISNDSNDVINIKNHEACDLLKNEAGTILWSQLEGKNKKRVLLIGDFPRCIKVQDFLKSSGSLFGSISILISSEDQNRDEFNVTKGSFSDELCWEKAGVYNADYILVLTKENRSGGSPSHELNNTIDSKSIILVNFARQMLNKKNEVNSNKTLIIAEMYDSRNKDLFDGVGVDILVPINTIISRMLSKTIYSKGVVCDYIFSFLNGDSTYVVREIKVKENDSWEGKRLSSLMGSFIEGFRILAVVPNDHRRKSTVSVISNSQNEDVLIMPGDILIGALDRNLVINLDRNVQN
jgi:uncharacterized protein